MKFPACCLLMSVSCLVLTFVVESKEQQFNKYLRNGNQEMCANDEPSASITVDPGIGPVCIPTVVRCGWECDHTLNCTSYNFHSNNNLCEIFLFPPANFSIVPGCSHFQDPSIASSLGTSSLPTPTTTAAVSKQMKARDCFDLYQTGFNTSGVYQIFPDPSQTNGTNVYCDMTTQGGGWTVFHRRSTGNVLFQRKWVEYENGFGNPPTDYWIGNRFLNWITSARKQKLIVNITKETSYGFASYSNFFVDNSTNAYKFTFDSYSASLTPVNIGDSLSFDKGSRFSTSDQDSSTNSCPSTWKGGWWYSGCPSTTTSACVWANLNGVFGTNNYWPTWICQQTGTMTYSEMKLKPMDFSQWP